MAARKILVSDFDSTMTQHDFFDRVRERWPRAAADDPWEKYLAGRVTHFEALAEIFRDIRTTEADLLAMADSMEIDPQLASAVQALQTGGWDVVVASAGCDWYIRHLLEAAGVEVMIYSNPGTFSPAHGLQMALPVDSPFLSPATGVDKLAIVRDGLDRAEDVAFAGDGRPDLEPALLVPPARRFARGWLAGALRERGEDFTTFDRWSQIVPHLLPC